MFLEELLRSPDFGAAIGNLARPFRGRWGLPEVHQLGLVVPDVENAADALTGQNIGPFFIALGAPRLWRERGQERWVQGKMALARYRGVELELLEPLEGSDFYTGSVDPKGAPSSTTSASSWRTWTAGRTGWPGRSTPSGCEGSWAWALCAPTSPTWTPSGRPGWSWNSSAGGSSAFASSPGPVLKAVGGLERRLGFRLRA